MIDIAAIEPHLSTILAVAVGAGFLAIIAAVAVLIAFAGKRRGVRTITPNPSKQQARKDRWLFAFAFGSASVVYVALIAGSFKGLTEWASSTLHWGDWYEAAIVPITVDGLGTAAGILAFRAVQKKTSPYMCYLMVWGATAASAIINAIQGGKHGGAAAFYMAFLSVAVMVMFHLFLGQFQAGAEYLGTKYVRFGLRWITYLGPTVLDFLCWVNHPPAAGLEPTVVNAVEHRKAHRERKAEAAHVAALVSAQRKAELSALQEDIREDIPGDTEPDSGPDSGQDTAADIRADRTPDTVTRGTRTRQRTARRDIRADIARARKTNPDISQKDLAKKLGVSEKTIQRNTPKPVANLTLVQKEAAK